MSTPPGGRRTPLHDRHARLGARFMPFAGWDMPVQYAGILAEHRAVRSAAGLFDVSHMGEIRVRGAGAGELLQALTPNDVLRLTPGQAQYSALLTDDGTFIDDLLVYRLDTADFLLVVNASNTATNLDSIRESAPGGVEIRDESDQTALLALQGPRAAAILSAAFGLDLAALRPFAFLHGSGPLAGGLVSRTGYTGEDGFEIYLPPAAAGPVWDRCLEIGAADGVAPCGLGARDTLRMEAGLCLYGHEIDRTVSPWEAGLDFIVRLEKGDFRGRAALLRQRQAGPSRRLTGLALTGRGLARPGHEVRHGDRPVATLTSGGFSPTLGYGIGMALLPPALAEPGTALTVRVRDADIAAEVVALPFYRRARRP